MTTVSDSADFPLIDLSSFLLPASDPTRVPITIESLVLPTSVLSSLSPTSAQPKAYVLYNILTPAECAGLIRLADTGLSPSGEPLLVPTNDGRTQRFVSSDRGIIRSPELSEVVWQRIKDVLAEHDEQVAGILEVKKDDDGMIGKSWKMEGRWMVQGLNDVWRLIRYEKGGHFGPHRDGVLATDVNHRSMKTFMFYLNGDFEGGTTNFIDDQSLYEDEVTSKIRARDGTIVSRVHPTAGMALVFNHGLLHEGDALLSGKKYILRSEIMFSRVDPLETSPKETEAIELKRQAELLESQDQPYEAVRLYRRAFKLCPEIENY